MFDLAYEDSVALPGDEMVQNPKRQTTRSLVIDASAEAIWPWLVQMTRKDADQGSTVLESTAPRVLVLGALFDAAQGAYLPFGAAPPAEHWRATWALVLSPIGARRTRLRVRSRVTFSGDAVRWTAPWTHPFNDFMDPTHLWRVKVSAEHAEKQLGDDAARVADGGASK